MPKRYVDYVYDEISSQGVCGSVPYTLSEFIEKEMPKLRERAKKILVDLSDYHRHNNIEVDTRHSLKTYEALYAILALLKGEK